MLPDHFALSDMSVDQTQTEEEPSRLVRKSAIERVISSNVLALPKVEVEQLHSSLYMRMPCEVTERRLHADALIFKKPTRAQIHRQAIPSEPRLEPLPALKSYQSGLNERAALLAGRKRSAESLRSDRSISKVQSVDLHYDYTLSELALGGPRYREGPGRIRGVNHTTKPSLPPITSVVEAYHFFGLQDWNKIIQALKDYPNLGFFYMTPAVSKSNIKYHYYNLKVCDHQRANRQDHCTISLKGITRMKEGSETEFIPLDRWLIECAVFNKLIKIPLFAKFRIWKAFVVWRHHTRSEKMFTVKTILNDQLFIVNPALRPALLNVREMSYRISDMGLCKVEKAYTYTLAEFKDAQFKQLSDVADRLKEFRTLVKEVVRSACRTALLEAGFTPDDYFYENVDSTGEGYSNQYDVDIFAEAPDKMTYTEQANKRANCRRLTNFIRLMDYLIINTMHSLAVNSVSTLLAHIVDHLKYTPGLLEIQAWTKPAPAKPEDEGEGDEGKKAADPWAAMMTATPTRSKKP